ncbi:DoxX family protein [Plantactinospora sp. B5E13]|uniref:DoxX family protein n=1 Tax=unclassified Plantactinospora TaxID=2631981 RepID=UPI00325CC7AE
MDTAYVAVTVMTAVANLFSACLDFARHERVVAAMRRGLVPLSWMVPLGVLKAAGALGLLVGFAFPVVGTVSAGALVLFFVGAVVVHLRARYHEFGILGVFLTLAVATLAVDLIRRLA